MLIFITCYEELIKIPSVSKVGLRKREREVKKDPDTMTTLWNSSDQTAVRKKEKN